jgi:amino acid adenylation domain-containing protein
MQQEISGGFQLSPPQKRLWTLQQTDPARLWRARSIVEIEGTLDTEGLRAAVESVVRRHDALQLSFRRLPGMAIPLQLRDEARNASWMPQQDWRTLNAREQESRLEALLQAEPATDTEQAALPCVSLIRLAETKHALFLDLPALCCDARGLDNIAREIARSYEASQRGEQAADESLQYTIISAWLNELLESEEVEFGRTYWRTQSLAANLNLRLPFELDSPRDNSFAPRSLESKVEAQTLNELEALARQQETPLASLLLAAYQLLLWRLTRASDITVGAAYDGRTDEELEGAIGLFTKYLPINCRFEERFRFGDVMSQVSAANREAVEWQECFVWEQASGAGVGETRFFPYCFTFAQDAGKHPAGQVSFTTHQRRVLVDRFKLNLSCMPHEDSLSLDFQYDPACFRREDVERLAGQFHTLLRSLLEHPERECARLELLAPAERVQLLEDFNHTGTDFGADNFIHRLVERQVERTPDAVAVVFGAEQLTYRELNRRSNQLAHYLRGMGVGADFLVGVCFERSLEMIVALFGILKAGGAYVPLDPAYPQEHLSFILEDTGARLLLTQERFAGALPETSAQRVYLESVSPELRHAAEDNPASDATPEHLAYVIYTSGSTGRPKGVMISHRAICNRLLWTQHTFPLFAHDTVLQKTVYSFDASVWEIFVPLLAGARLVLAEPGGHQDSAYLVQAIIEHGVTTLQLVPSALRVLLEEEKIDECKSLRRMFCGGEALSAEVVEAFFRHLDAELINLYGPTEASIDATYREIKGILEQRIAPIGKPLANVQMYLLDVYQNPVPLFVEGEVHIGGVGLARGYLRQPELTATKFIPHPFSDRRGARLYKTGDLGRQLPDGTIEFVGRTDHQIKLRGFRIEPGEIEALLRQHALVRESIVTLREDTPGDHRLVAYVVAPEANVPELRDYLKDKLPAHMIPSAVVLMETLPTLPNGKIDRKSLPAPDALRPEMVNAYVAPHNPVQEHLAELWSEVLGIERIGINDNFFDLGGHSLLATQFITRLREIFHVELSLRRFFESPNIAKLSEIILESLVEQTGDDEMTQFLSEIEELPEAEAQSLSTTQH